jgi:hypothetical protein
MAPSSTTTLPQSSSLEGLPSLDELAARDETVKVTLMLSKLSVDFFKQEARTRRTQYQRMIRRLLDEYVERQARVDDDATDLR